MISSFLSEKLSNLNKNLLWKQNNGFQLIKSIQVIKKKRQKVPFIFDLSEINLQILQKHSKLYTQRQALEQLNQNKLHTARENSRNEFKQKKKQFDIQFLNLKQDKITFGTDFDRTQRKSNKYFSDKSINSKNMKQKWEVKIKNNKLSIQEIVSGQETNKFLIIQNFKCPLAQGSIIKFGKTPFQVIKLSTSFKSYKMQYNQNQSTDKFIIKQQSQIQKSKQSSDKQICKFCLMNNVQFTNLKFQDNGDDLKLDSLLLSPCKCKGSCSKVHWLCLKQWAQSKFKIKDTQTVQIYDYSRLVCQICKEKIPLRYGIELERKSSNFPIKSSRSSKRTQNFRDKNIQHSEIMNKKYITINLLESLSFDQQKETNRTYIWLRNYCQILQSNSFKNQIYIKLKYSQGKTIKIGREKLCNWQIEDPTVSRFHAQIQFNIEKQLFYLKDQGSKFGTMIKLQTHQQLDLNKFKQIPSIKIIVCDALLAISLKHNQGYI